MLNPQPSGKVRVMVRVRVGLRLGLGKSLFPVSRAKDQRLPAGPIATAYIVCNGREFYVYIYCILRRRIKGTNCTIVFLKHCCYANNAI